VNIITQFEQFSREKIEESQAIKEATVREIQEESGVMVKESDLGKVEINGQYCKLVVIFSHTIPINGNSVGEKESSHSNKI